MLSWNRLLYLLVCEDNVDIRRERVFVFITVLILLHPFIIPSASAPSSTPTFAIISRLIITIGRIWTPSVPRVVILVVGIFVIEFVVLLVDLLMTVILLVVLDPVVRGVIVLVGTLRRSFLCRSHSFTLANHK